MEVGVLADKAGAQLTAGEQKYVVDTLMEWIRRQME